LYYLAALLYPSAEPSVYAFEEQRSFYFFPRWVHTFVWQCSVVEFCIDVYAINQKQCGKSGAVAAQGARRSNMLSIPGRCTRSVANINRAMKAKGTVGVKEVAEEGRRAGSRDTSKAGTRKQKQGSGSQRHWHSSAAATAGRGYDKRMWQERWVCVCVACARLACRHHAR